VRVRQQGDGYEEACFREQQIIAVLAEQEHGFQEVQDG
jgi:hypothetical protein